VSDQSTLRHQAETLGLTLTDEDLAGIATILDKSRAGIASLRPETTDGLEPSYVFTPIRPPDERGDRAGTS
jgi:hypothetical protein